MKKLGFLLIGIFSFSLNATHYAAMDFKGSPGAASQSILFVHDNLVHGQNRLKTKKRDYLVRHYQSQLLTQKDAEGNTTLLDLDQKMPSLGTEFLEETNPYSFRKNFFSRRCPAYLGGILVRTLDLCFLWGPINYTAMIVNHEVFGHGYRVRDLGKQTAEVHRYSFFPNFGLSSAIAATHMDFNRMPTAQEYLAISIAGMEANKVLSHNLELSFIEQGKIDARQSMLWGLTHGDTFNYVFSLENKDIESEGYSHDVASYINFLVKLQPGYKTADQLYKDISQRALASILLNPFLYLNYKAQFSYIFYNSAVAIKGFKIPDTQLSFYPSYNFRLTPFGPENIYECYLWGDNLTPTYLYLREGSFGNQTYTGLGVENNQLLKTSWGTFGGKLDLWLQPQMQKNQNVAFDSDAYIDEEKLLDEIALTTPLESRLQPGACASIVYQAPLTKSQQNRVWVQAGYKFAGYVPGESLRSGLILKSGLNFAF